MISSHSSSISNPCPSGTGIGYGTFNGTIFIICDASFPHTAQVDSLALSLGLGLGLGIPFMISIFIFLWQCKDRYHKSEIIIQEKSVFTSKDIVEKELSPELCQSFIQGNLTFELKKKLFELHEIKGRRLDEYIKYAIESHQYTLGEWISQLSFTTLQEEDIIV